MDESMGETRGRGWWDFMNEEMLNRQEEMVVGDTQVCKVCSALVMDMTVHLAWHAGWRSTACSTRTYVDELHDRTTALENSLEERSEGDE